MCERVYVHAYTVNEERTEKEEKCLCLIPKSFVREKKKERKNFLVLNCVYTEVL